MAKEITVTLTDKELDMLMELIKFGMGGIQPKPSKKEKLFLFELHAKLQLIKG